MDPTQPQPMSHVAASLIRTWVPIAIGALLTWVATRTGVVIDADTSATIGAFAAMAVAAGYYALARALESSRRDALRRIGGFMLGGVLARPAYLSPDQWERLSRTVSVGRHRAPE